MQSWARLGARVDKVHPTCRDWSTSCPTCWHSSHQIIPSSAWWYWAEDTLYTYILIFDLSNYLLILDLSNYLLILILYTYLTCSPTFPYMTCSPISSHLICSLSAPSMTAFCYNVATIFFCIWTLYFCPLHSALLSFALLTSKLCALWALELEQSRLTFLYNHSPLSPSYYLAWSTMHITITHHLHFFLIPPLLKGGMVSKTSLDFFKGTKARIWFY